jgi:hypothetical protein
MKTKLLCITMLIFTVLIFGANHYAARNELSDDLCTPCFCQVTLVTVKDPKAKDEPSCSVVFSTQYANGKTTTGQQLYSHERGQPYYDLSGCNPVLFCDKNAEVQLKCTSGYGKPLLREREVLPGERCLIKCEERGGVSVAGFELSAPGKYVNINCDVWERPAPTPAPKPPSRKRGLQWQESSVLPGFFGETMQTASVISRLLPAKHIYEPADERGANGTITGSTLWWLLDGEAGIDHGMLMVATGEAEARSFCTGDTIRLVGPNVLSLPTCQPDVSGRWEGNYARRLSNGTREAVTINLNLRKESGSLRGELTTPDGTFNIVKASQDGSDIRLEAERTVAGTQAKIYLNGRVTKGVIVFSGSFTGFVRRLYIADSALPLAVLNQPYSFSLTAFGPEGQRMTFRLATPAITPPEQITWNKDAKDLRGRNGERFTYGCPARPPTNPSVYGTDVYTDDSPICNAAVHSGLISPQAGGVVTIQIKPDAGSYTASARNGVSSKSYGAWKGSYVFVKGESNGGERGRLPKGISFDSRSGTFLGTPTELGSFDISVVADDGAGNVFEQPLTFTVKKLVVTNGLLPDGFVGQPYAATLKAAGGQPPYRFSGSPPKGLQLDPITGEVSGTPSSSTAYDRYGNRTSAIASFEVTIRDSQDSSESQKVSLNVRGATILNSHFLPDARVGVPYRTQFQAVGALSPINWVFGRDDASLIGLALNERTGELSGTPMKAGNFFIEVRAEVGSSVPTRNFALTIK